MTTFTSEDREMAAKHDGIESPHNACCYKDKCRQQQAKIEALKRRELTDEEKLQFGMLFMNWNRSLKEPLVKPAYEQYVFEQAIAILRKASEK